MDYDGSASGSVEDLTFPNRLVEGAPDATNHRLDPSLEATEGRSRPLVKTAYQKRIFLFLNQNICCGYTKEPS